MVSALPPGGQRPISLEYQIYLPAIDTIVTGMTQTSLRWVAPNLARCKERVGEPDDKPLKIFQRCILIGGRSGLEPAGLFDNDQVGSKMREHEHPLAMLGENAHQWNSAPSSRLTAPHIFSRGPRYAMHFGERLL